MPRPACPACHGLGSIRMTVHFYAGDHEWEAACWECFGTDVKLQFPRPKSTDN
jgi:DnaJ-class molecular chaperone